MKDDALYTYADNASAGIKDDGGNIGITKAGWYIVVVRMSVEGRDIKYQFEINEPNVYLMGPVAPVNDWQMVKENLFTVPADADGDFVSPAFADNSVEDSGVRACVNVGVDWWKSEFIVLNGEVAYRGTEGDQERVQGTKGQKLYLNFTKGTGSIK